MAKKSNKDSTRTGILVAVLLVAAFFFAQAGGFLAITGAPISTTSPEVSAALSGACVGLASTPRHL